MAKKLRPLPIVCCICTAAISEERIRRGRGAVTCSTKCQAELKKRRRQRDELTFCRRCGQPCTPEERKAFNAWRLAEGKKRPKAGRPKMTEEEKRTAAEARYLKKHGVPMPTQAAFTEMINV